MTYQEKMTASEELFEVDSGKITAETDLDTLPWDSMSMLSVIALVNEHFGKRISGVQIKSFKKIGDILDFMV